MADDEVTRLSNNLKGLNLATLDANAEFQGMAKTLIQWSDSTSRAGKKWTIFSRIVSGSPIWKLQNKVRAFVDVLAQIEESAVKNTEAAMKQNKRTIELVQSQSELTDKLTEANTIRKILRLGHGKAAALRMKENKDIQEAIKGTLAYNRAKLLGKSVDEQVTAGLDEILAKGKQQKKLYEDLAKAEKFKENLESKAGRGRIKSGIRSQERALKRKDFFLTKERKTPQATTQLELFKNLEDKISATLRLGERRQKLQEKMAKRTLKYRKGMIGLQKTMKPVLNYAFKVMIMIMLGIIGFMVLAKFIYDSLGILQEMGVINDIMAIGSLVLDNVMLIFGMIGALLSGDIYTFMDYALEFVDNLLLIGLGIIKVVLKGILALAIGVFYTGLDIIHKFFTDDKFRSAVFKIAKKALFIFLAAYVVKQIVIQMLTVAAIYALPVLAVIAFTGLFFALVKKIADIVKDTFKLDFMASGGVSAGGMTVVGERGPELVNLPKGSRVHSNSESKKMAGGSVVNNFNITVNAKDLSDAELRRVAKQLGNDIFKNINRTSTGRGFV